MYFKILNSLLALFISISFVACSSTPKKEEEAAPVVAETPETSSRNMNQDPAEEYNTQVAEFRYPDGTTRPGFNYKKADVQNDFADWAKKNVDVIKTALEKLPDYVLQITGHTDAVGPEQPEGDKKGNMYYSEQRANAVKQALVKQGIAADKIVTKGMGSSSPISGIDSKDAKNRRVTFSYIKKEAPPQNQ